ncbi:LacI family DNA-binding transcriptional regulator [Plantibacter sp. VKM Ac-2885]|uniref:LacI family DNA-binding transcriptional regulator n=1 Tax=Plantibacter sp. VKM Ac-2885 TaxID=2783828 RepID=UPI00188D71B7|nr:LacI family DNA-binding transcriptional regulator [Plantibacter sp. VKM Ac-2885]MBF4514175.1 LacI family DNA-binding transcriptional regulator [Plantibacter sp. VKM Ac-2885]
MTSSADVAAKAGVSRSTVSQILNGHGHRFRLDMVDHVQTVAKEMGYRPSIAGRALARGTSDIVITLLPNISLGPRLRELIDRVTDELAAAGRTNLIRLSSGDAQIDEAVLALRPAGLWSVAPLTLEQHSRLAEAGVNVVDQPRSLQEAVDHEIGAMQARHLIDRGYTAVAAAVPVDLREQPFALARERGAHNEFRAADLEVLPTIRLSLERGSTRATAAMLPHQSFGVAAYNDDAGLAIMAAAAAAGREVPGDIGVIGVDNTVASGVSEPTLSTVDLDVRFSAHEIVRALLQGQPTAPDDALDALRSFVSIVDGGSTAR